MDMRVSGGARAIQSHESRKRRHRMALCRWLTRIALCAALMVLLNQAPVGAAAVRDVEQTWTFSLYIENDLFSNTDQDYTNGIKATWISPDLTSYAQSDRLPEWSLPLIQLLPFINEPGLQRNIAFSIGQNMYTPEDISKSALIVNDRPYAGWTYGSVAFHSKNDRRLDSFELQAGIVGPQSYAEQTQKLVHDLIDSPIPQGWNNQLKNEPGLELIYERKWRSFRRESNVGFGFDLISHLGAAVGNVYTYANTGIEARLGWNVPIDFGTSLIRPAGDSNAPAAQRDPRITGEAKSFGFYLFTAIDGRAVARDIFLDGNTFADSHNVEKKYFVADIAGGVSLIMGPFKVSYAHAFRTKEFTGQEDDHKFGSITLSFSY